MSQVYDILTSLGYRLKDEGEYYRTAPNYRDCINQTEMVVRKDNGVYTDFGNSSHGSLQKLVRLTVGPEQAGKILENYDPNKFSQSTVSVKIPKKYAYDRSILKKLIPKWDMYLEAGVSEETMREFEVGLKIDGHLFNRYCLPIYDNKEVIVGFAGRHHQKKVPANVPKWKLHGHKKEWLWPAHLNASEITKKKQVILVESPNCVFHLWDAGVKNVICLFGVEMSPKVFHFLICEDLDKIIIATNNDAAGNGYAGQNAADKIQRTLLNYFAPNKIKIHLPTQKDFGEMSKAEILKWEKSLKETQSE